MIIRINNRKEGIVEYLKTGHRQDSEYTRDEKDKVVSITGDLDLIDKTIKYINNQKKYKDAYQHITISFTEKDFEKFYNYKYDAYDLDKIQELIDEFMSLYLAGYDKSEYTYYAELHYPKIKREHNKDRLPHIHIVLPLLNLISDTKLKPAFFSIKTNDLLQTCIAKKYDLDLPIYHKKDENAPKIKPLSREGLKRKELQELLKDIKTEQELLQFFKDNNLQYRKVETKKNCYYKIINPNGKDINLRGRGLEHLEEIARTGIAKGNVKGRKKSIAEQHAQMSLQELKEELQEYLRRRVEEISKRRSKKTIQKLLKIKQEQTYYKTKELQQQQISTSSKLPFSSRREPISIPPRPSNSIEQTYKEKEDQKTLSKDYIKEIKENLDPNKVLEYAVSKYKLDKSKYIIIGNKIKNLTNKQKPKSVIDFLTKEVGLSVKEAFSAVDKLYQEQLKERRTYERNYSRIAELIRTTKENAERESRNKRIVISIARRELEIKSELAELTERELANKREIATNAERELRDKRAVTRIVKENKHRIIRFFEQKFENELTKQLFEFAVRIKKFKRELTNANRRLKLAISKFRDRIRIKRIRKERDVLNTNIDNNFDFFEKREEENLKILESLELETHEHEKVEKLNFNFKTRKIKNKKFKL